MFAAQLLRRASSCSGSPLAAASEAARRWQAWQPQGPHVDRTPRRHYSLQSTGTFKRFYDRATISEVPGSPGHWHVLLDGRKVKTPSHAPLAVPSQMLAMAIAAEFQGQTDSLVRPIMQPLFRLQWQVQEAAFTPTQLVERLLQYVDSDPVCLRTPRRALSSRLRDAQERVYHPIVAWASHTFGVPLATSESLFGAEQSPEASFAYAHHLHALPYPQLLALTELAGAARSLLIAFAVHGGQLSAAQAVKAARVEEDCQMEVFGLVEGGHDIDEADLATRVAGCALFLRAMDADAAAPGAAQRRVLRDVDAALSNLERLGFG